MTTTAKNATSLLLITFSIFSFQFSTAQNYALDFDGNNDYVTLKNFDLNESFSIEFWIKPKNKTGSQLFVGKHTSSGGHILMIGYYGKALHIRIREATANFTTASSPLLEYQHLAVVAKKISSSKTEVSMYRNGNLLATKTINGVLGNPSSSLAWVLGVDYDSGPVKNDYYKGKMDEVRFWNKLLTQEEIRENMNKKLTGNEPNLVAYYPMSEGSGSTIKDASVNSNNGRLK